MISLRWEGGLIVAVCGWHSVDGGRKGEGHEGGELHLEIAGGAWLWKIVYGLLFWVRDEFLLEIF